MGWVVLASTALLLLAGCHHGGKPPISGRWEIHAPFYSDTGKIDLEGGTFTMSGKAIGGEDASFTARGNYSQTGDHFYMQIVAVEYDDPKNEISTSFRNSEHDDLIGYGKMDLQMVWLNDNIVQLISTAKGPGPEGEANFVLQHNGANAASLPGGVSVSISKVNVEGQTAVQPPPSQVTQPTQQNAPPQQRKEQNSMPPPDSSSSQPDTNEQQGGDNGQQPGQSPDSSQSAAPPSNSSSPTPAAPSTGG